MTKWFPLQESDDEVIATAPTRFVHKVEIAAPRRRVWEALTADDAIVSWTPLITSVEWTSPRPFGVGTERIVTLGYALQLKERFYRWDEGERMTFTVDAASAPGFVHFAEDLVLADSPKGTTLTWTFASTPAAWFKPVSILGGPGLRLATRNIAQGIRRIR